MHVPPDATGIDVFPHDDYHFYILDHETEPRHIYLPEDVVHDARHLIDTDFSTTEDWTPKFFHDLGDGVWFKFYPNDPSLSEFQYDVPFSGNKRLFGAAYDKHVRFDSPLLSASTGPPADHHQHHYKEIRQTVILPEHREHYMNALIEWEETGGWDTDWIEQ